MEDTDNRVEIRVLSQLQAAHSVIHILSPVVKVAEFVSQAIKIIPGVKSCSLCFKGLTEPVGDYHHSMCTGCEVPLTSIQSEKSFPCPLKELPHFRMISLRTADYNFGYVLMEIDPEGEYSRYDSFLQNFTNSIAITLENKWQKEQLGNTNEELRSYQDHLEDLVRERTAAMVRVNEQLKQEIEERKLFEDALKTSEEEYRNLFERMPIGLYKSTPAGKIVEANHALISKLGYRDFSSLSSCNINDIYLDREDRRRYTTLIEKENIVQDFELQLKRRDGSVLWMKSNSRAVRDENGTIAYYEGSLEDITKRKSKEMEMKRRVMNFKLEEGNLYLVREGTPGLSLEAFKDLLSVGYKGSIISRNPWEDFRDNIEGTYDFLWLSGISEPVSPADASSRESGESQTTGISQHVAKETRKRGPGRLQDKRSNPIMTNGQSWTPTGLIHHIIPSIDDLKNHIDKNIFHTVFLIDRLDYLILKFGFKRVMEFIQWMREQTYLKASIIILSVDSSTVTDKQITLIEKECRSVEPLQSLPISEKLFGLLKYIYRMNMQGIRPYYSLIRKEFGTSKPTISNRIRALTSLGYVKEDKHGRMKVVELTEKGRGLFWH